MGERYSATWILSRTCLEGFNRPVAAGDSVASQIHRQTVVKVQVVAFPRLEADLASGDLSYPFISDAAGVRGDGSISIGAVQEVALGRLELDLAIGTHDGPHGIGGGRYCRDSLCSPGSGEVLVAPALQTNLLAAGQARRGGRRRGRLIRAGVVARAARDLGIGRKRRLIHALSGGDVHSQVAARLVELHGDGMPAAVVDEEPSGRSLNLATYGAGRQCDAIACSAVIGVARRSGHGCDRYEQEADKTRLFHCS